MGQKGLTGFFENFLKQEPIFTNKKVLQSTYTPKTILHRDEQIDQLASILAPILRLERPSNVFVYGRPGSGKSLTIQHVCSNILRVAEKNKLEIKILYLNCKLKGVADTQYRLIANLAREFGIEVPVTGLPTDEIYKLFIKAIEKEKTLLIIILDEIDQLVKKIGDEILYNLTRINTELKNTEISLIGISNDLVFTNSIDPRVKSSLSEEELIFPPYNALQLQDILRQRAKIAFRNETIEEGVIEKCSAYAAREHGDARRALELLRVAGEISERKGKTNIKITDIDEAEEKIDKDTVIDIINTQPKQFKLVLYSITKIHFSSTNTPIFTGEIYDMYKEACFKVGLRPLTQRRVSDIIAEMDMLGIITTRVISKGRYGRTREICLAISDSIINNVSNILKEGLSL
ncbi:ORC1-type DNA replication protein [Candidatus Woesearchaeota archaeon]|nr:ORC1-type DNA replication protein [Candidatus Woesearchaeota archaeon]